MRSPRMSFRSPKFFKGNKLHFPTANPECDTLMSLNKVQSFVLFMVCTICFIFLAGNTSFKKPDSDK